MKQHKQLPFHRVDRWNGKFFAMAALWQTGVKIHLGHHGMPCPQYVGGTGQDGENTGIAEDAEEEMMPDADPEDSEDEDVFDFEEVSGVRQGTQPQTTADWYWVPICHFC